MQNWDFYYHMYIRIYLCCFQSYKSNRINKISKIYAIPMK